MKLVRECLVVLLVFFTVSLAFTRDTDNNSSQKVDFKKVRNDMSEAYRNGELNRVIELYKNKCCEEVKTKKKKTAIREKREFKKIKDNIRAEIYHWVALSFIALDQPEKGEIFIRKLLVLRRGEKLDDYWLSIRNIAREKYYVAPRWLVGIKLGPTFTTAHPGEPFSIFEPAETSTEGKEYGFYFTRGMQWNVIVEYALNKNLSISFQPANSELRFRYKDTHNWEGEGDIKQVTTEFLHRQRFNYVDLPVILKYQWGKSKLNPYVQIGGFCSILYIAFKTIEINSTYIKGLEEKKTSGEKKTIKDINIMKQIKTFHFGFLVGGGVSLDTGFEGLRLAIEVNYKHGLNNIVDANHRYGNEELVFGYYDVFDDIKLKSWDLTIKVLLPISFKAFKR